MCIRDRKLNFRAASCCFIRERLSTSVAFMTCISRGVTAESETHYRGITALFSWSVPIPAVITAVTAALPRLRSPCHPLVQNTQQSLTFDFDSLWFHNKATHQKYRSKVCIRTGTLMTGLCVELDISPIPPIIFTQRQECKKCVLNLDPRRFWNKAT